MRTKYQQYIIDAIRKVFGNSINPDNRFLLLVYSAAWIIKNGRESDYKFLLAQLPINNTHFEQLIDIILLKDLLYFITFATPFEIADPKTFMDVFMSDDDDYNPAEIVFNYLVIKKLINMPKPHNKTYIKAQYKKYEMIFTDERFSNVRKLNYIQFNSLICSIYAFKLDIAEKNVKKDAFNKKPYMPLEMASILNDRLCSSKRNQLKICRNYFLNQDQADDFVDEIPITQFAGLTEKERKESYREICNHLSRTSPLEAMCAIYKSKKTEYYDANGKKDKSTSGIAK